MKTGRVPPNSEDSERGLLGAILLNPERVMGICSDLNISPDHFYAPWHRNTFALFQEMTADNRPIDLRTFCDRARTLGRIDAVGGDAAIEKLIDACPTEQYADYYANEVCEKFMLRSIIDRSREVIDACYGGERTAEEIRSSAEFELARLQHTKPAKETNRTVIQRAIDGWKLARTRGCAGTPTGFRFLDTYFGGMLDCGFYIFSGGPGCCKTTLARNICENIAMRGIPSSILTLEQTSDQIWGAIAARHARQSIFHLNSGSLMADIESVERSRDIVCDWPIAVEDRPHTLEMIHSWARRAVSKHGSRLLVVDYIQRISEKAKRDESEASRVGNISRTLANIAKEVRCPMIAISSLSRAGNLRGSGDLDYDAWAWINMDKASDWGPKNLKYTVSFEKQRFGPPAYDETLWLIGNEQRLDETEPE